MAAAAKFAMVDPASCEGDVRRHRLGWPSHRERCNSPRISVRNAARPGGPESVACNTFQSCQKACSSGSRRSFSTASSRAQQKMPSSSTSRLVEEGSPLPAARLQTFCRGTAVSRDSCRKPLTSRAFTPTCLPVVASSETPRRAPVINEQRPLTRIALRSRGTGLGTRSNSNLPSARSKTTGLEAFVTQSK